MQFLTKLIKLLLTFFSENFLNQNMFLIKVLEYIIYLKVYIKFMLSLLSSRHSSCRILNIRVFANFFNLYSGNKKFMKFKVGRMDHILNKSFFWSPWTNQG